MQHPSSDARSPAATVPWNKGKIIGARPPLQTKHVWSIRTKLRIDGKTRDLAPSRDRQQAERVRRCVPQGRRRCSSRVNGRPGPGPSAQNRTSCEVRTDGTDSGSRGRLHQGRAETARRVSVRKPRQAGPLHLDTAVFSPSLELDRWYWPRSKAVWNAFTPSNQGHADIRRTGNLRAVQLLLGHTKIESTVRFLGIEVDDALTIAEQVDV
jgi:hypothetical protein